MAARTADIGSGLVARILALSNALDDKLSELVADAKGRLRTTAEPASGFRALDLSSTDVSFTAGSEPRSIYVGTAGDVKVDGYDESGNAVTGVTFKNANAGLCLPLGRVTKVYKTGTTAADLVGLW